MLSKIMNNKIFKTFYNIIKYSFFTIVVIYVSFVVIQRVTDNKAILGYRLFTVATGSMIPVYNVGDIVVVKSTDPNTLKVGDDIAYMGSKLDFKGRLVTHRIISIENKDNNLIFQTKGVANEEADYKIDASQIYGKVTNKLLVIGFINKLLKNQYGFFFFVFVPLVLIIFLEIADSIIEIKLEKNILKEVDTKEEVISTKESDDDEEII